MNIKKNNTDPIKTVLVIVLGFLIIYTVFNVKWALYTSLIIGIAGMLSKFLAHQIDFLWMKLAWLLSLIIPNILLSVIFYILLTPIAFLSKIFGEKNQLDLKNTSDSLFKDHKRKIDKRSFENPW